MENFAFIQPPLEGFGLRWGFMITHSPENFCLRETVKWFLPIVDKSAHFLSDFLWCKIKIKEYAALLEKIPTWVFAGLQS